MEEKLRGIDWIFMFVMVLLIAGIWAMNDKIVGTKSQINGLAETDKTLMQSDITIQSDISRVQQNVEELKNYEVDDFNFRYTNDSEGCSYRFWASKGSVFSLVSDSMPGYKKECLKGFKYYLCSENIYYKEFEIKCFDMYNRLMEFKG